MAFIFMLMVTGLLIRVIAILGMEAAARIDRYLANEKVEGATLFRMKVMYEKPIIKESLVNA